MCALIWFGHAYHWVEAAGGPERDGFAHDADQVRAGAWPDDPFRPPLYVLVVAAAGAAFRTDSFSTARTVSSVAAVGLCLIAFALGRRIGDERAGLFAMAWTAVSGPSEEKPDMVLNSILSRIGSALPLMATVLALANWNARPAAAWAWAAVIVISVVMVAVQRFSQRASSRSSGNAALARGADSVAVAVVFGALMMIIPLALTLAHAYGLVDDPDSGMRRTTMIILGAYLAMTGNAMPRMLPPTSSLPCGGARVQAFQQHAGWTWVLCGLGYAMAGLALPIDAAGPISMALVATAMIVTIVQLLRLLKPRPHAPRLN